MPDAAAESAPEPFVARFSIPKLVGWAALSGGMAGLSLMMASATSDTFGLVIGGIGAAFFGSIAAVHVTRLFDRRPQVTIDGNGLYVRSHSEKRIALRSITGLHTDMGRLSLGLYKPAKYPIERWHRRLIYRINGSAARGFFGDVWIWSNQLDHPRDAFVAALAAHRPKTDFERQLDALSAAG